MTSKFEDAKNRARGNAPATDAKPVEFDPMATPLIEKLDMREFAEAIANGGQLGERFLEMEEGEQFRAFFLGTSKGLMEEVANGKVVLKEVTRIHFEYATKDRKGTGITFSVLEYSQLKNQICDVLPHDGSAFVLVGKGAMGETKKKRKMQHFIVARFPDTRAPRRRLEASTATSAAPDAPVDTQSTDGK